MTTTEKQKAIVSLLSSRRQNQPRIGVIAERRYLRQLMPTALIENFAARGIAVDVICPQGGQFDPRRGVFQSEQGEVFNLSDYDLVISRNRSGLGLTMLSYAKAAGVLAINSPVAIQRVRNKAEMAIVLERADAPCPPTILAENLSVLAALNREWFPLILKATYGDNSQGLRVVRQPEELADIHWNDDPILAQKFLPSDGRDLKLYVCGMRVFAVRKPSPIGANPNAVAQPIEPTAAMITLARKAGAIFELEIYGVDVVENADGLHVIEVNDFPNFTGVPGAADYLVDFILSRLKESLESSAWRAPKASGRR